MRKFGHENVNEMEFMLKLNEQEFAALHDNGTDIIQCPIGNPNPV